MRPATLSFIINTLISVLIWGMGWVWGIGFVYYARNHETFHTIWGFLLMLAFWSLAYKAFMGGWDEWRDD